MSLENEVGNTKKGNAIAELQGMKPVIVDGVDASGSDQTVSLSAGTVHSQDTILFVLAIDGDNGTLSSTVQDATADVSISADDELTVANTDWSSYRLVAVVAPKPVPARSH